MTDKTAEATKSKTENDPEPEVETKPLPTKYMVSRNFTQRVNGTTIPYSAGTIIDRPDLIRELIATNSPLVPIEADDDIGTCPHCGKSFSMQAQRGAQELLARARLIMPGIA